jgi:hypothetical protein
VALSGTGWGLSDDPAGGHVEDVATQASQV